MVRNVGGGQTPQDYFYDLDPITRFFLVAVVGTTCGVSFQFIDPGSIALLWPNIVKKFEIWRIFSNFMFFGTFSFPTLIQIYMLVQYSGLYEADPFNTGAGGTSADFAWMLVIGAAVLSFFGYLFMTPFLGPSLSFMILYVWSKKHPDGNSSFFGFQVQALYLPWVLLTFHMLIGNDIFMPGLGIAAGHVYYFLHYIAPEAYGFEIIKTPVALIDMFGQYTPPQSSARGRAAAGGRPQAGHNWGGGNVLGGT